MKIYDHFSVHCFHWLPYFGQDDYEFIKDINDEEKCSIFKDDLDANPVNKEEVTLIKLLPLL